MAAYECIGCRRLFDDDEEAEGDLTEAGYECRACADGRFQDEHQLWLGCGGPFHFPQP